MRDIKYIVIHCTATQQTATVFAIKNYWKNNLGWANPGYHYIVEADGRSSQLQPLRMPANGVKGYNSNSIHISYIGGIDGDGKPLDNRTEEQKKTLLRIVKELKQQYPNAIIQGHRDFPGVAKACPSFDVRKWISECLI